MPDLILRKVPGHVHAPDAYRVVYKGIAVGSIGKQLGAHQRVFWSWGIDTVLPRQKFATEGEGRDRDDCTAQFRAVWEAFASEPERLAAFMELKRQREANGDQQRT